MQESKLSFLKKIILDLKQAHRVYEQPDANLFLSGINDVAYQKKQLLQSFSESRYDFNNKEQATWYIRQQQQQLISFMEQIADDLTKDDILSLNQPSIEPTWENLFKFIYTDLAELLSFLEREYAGYMDAGCKIHAGCLLSNQVTLAAELSLVEEKLKEYTVNEKLLSVVLLPFREFFDASHIAHSITCYQLSYLKELKTALLLLLKDLKPNTDPTHELQDVLHHLNFNSTPYFKYWIASAKSEINAQPTTRDKGDWLIYMKKEIRQTVIKPALVLNKANPSLQKQQLSWLSDEINYYKEKESQSHSIPVPDKFYQWKDYKVVTALSVPQLANTLRLFVDGGLYLNQNKTELLDFFSNFFTTTKQDNVSSGSLRSHFYKDNAGVSKAVREILRKLINRPC
ncbi:MAG TPA: hypothetical protein VM802_30350 [Chitinophaga sp.]|uniref:hypothetical protein n=1 Tax=Chitinophaga sp. TaxID=1869181 RepID=UPI002BB93561|nr:hypothetical protein [Chitinophaga sp.]HVI49208.1 hypothetical protein [Chitinophaga sp.]